MKYIEIHWLIVFSTIFVSIIILNNLNILKTIVNLLNYYQIFINSYFSKEDDKIKFKRIIFYSYKIISETTIFLLKIFLVVFPILFSIFFSNLFKINLINHFLSIESLLIAAFILIIFSKFFSKSKDYNKFDQSIHRLIVNNNLLLNLCFDIENFFTKKRNNSHYKKKLFICGYARAGTTLVLNTLYSSGDFNSLLYKNLPFLLSPRINNFITKFIFSNNLKRSPRAHGDGILIDKNSPEAFEEIFWKSKLNNEFIFDKYLTEHTVNDNILKEFENFVRLLIDNEKIYLSKNNNNILRIDSLLKMANSNVFVIIRDPIHHSLSLLNQHLMFSKFQEQDNFIEQYMTSLGHYEFGKNQKSFFNLDNIYSKNSLNFWLEEWRKVYSKIYKKNHDTKNKVYFLTYEGFCENPQLLFDKINDIFKISIKNNLNITQRNKNEINLKKLEIDEALIAECNQIYKKIKNISIA